MPLRPRRVLAAAMVVALQLALLGLAAVPGAPQARAATKPNLRIVLSAITSSVANPADTVTASGTVTNTGDVALSSVNAYLWYTHDPIKDRTALTVASRETPGTQDDGERVVEPWRFVDTVTDTLEPGKSRPFTLNVPIERLELTQPGVYSIGVDVRAYAVDSGDRHTWSVRTFLPYVPAAAQAKPVDIAFTLPMAASPGLVGGDEVLDESVARTFAPDGRMRELLAFGAKYDLSFLVDPELLAEAEVIAEGYRTLGNTTKETEGAADAKAFLDEAQATFGAHDTLLLPYADPDVNALDRAGLTPQLGEAFSAAERAMKAYRASPPIAWPGSGFATAETLETIAANRGRRVILSKNALPDLPDDGTAPVVSLVTPEGAVTALVADPKLTAGGPKGDDPGVMQRQRLLAETAMLALASGGAGTAATAPSRRVVAALPREFEVDANADALMKTVQTTPWLRQISAGFLLNSPPAAYGGKLAYPASVRKAELNADMMSALRTYSDSSLTYLDLLFAPEERRGGLYQAFLRGSSNAWRRSSGRGTQLVAAMRGEIGDLVNEVQVVPPRLVTLSSRTGRFPVTISNTSKLPVVVGLKVDPRDTGLLEVAPIEPVRIDPGRKATVTVHAEAATGGVVQLMIGLQTKQGIPFGTSAALTLRVTDYGRVGWLVIGFGVGLLMLAAAVKIVRRVRGTTARKDPEPTPEEQREHSHL